MIISVPISVIKDSGTKHPVYSLKPLYFDEPEEDDENLERGLNRFQRKLEKHLETIARKSRHDKLLRWFFDGNAEIKIVDLAFEFRKRYHKIRHPFVLFTNQGKKLCRSTKNPSITLELSRQENLEDRVTEVMLDHFKKEFKRYEDDGENPEDYHFTGSAWVSRVEIELSPEQGAKKRDQTRMNLFGEDEDLDGYNELSEVARDLDSDSHQPQVLIGRDSSVDEVYSLLESEDYRPILLLGPPMVGKTAIINDVVCRRKANRRSKSTRKGHIWHIFPQRLISGMSYVGQWENRLLAILKEVKKKKLILYFDDLIGLYFAGISAQSSLNVAMVMKPFVERRDIRILAEITPEKFQKLKELDRGFADLFHVIPVSETDEQLSWEIMLSTQRHLEELEGCEFSLEALPELMNISRRYMKNLAFPGKSARLMGQLAVKYRHKTVSRHDVLKTFHERSGLSLTLLDDRKKLAWKDVVQSLKEDVVGQEAALEAMANSVCIAKARLNDTQRPLATFLFLGPSGVGKTQCAVSLAKYLFGSEDRIIRFDMNEYMTSTAVSNLCGTLEKPEGLLTGTIRRQPFSVILLDEIEKAHSDVYDLLLQVLGEGRLTDSLGRTTDFTNTFIVMTSNLGVRENWSSTGFHRGEDQKGLSYRKAVQNFFRPEFYNRIDQIIPFKQLARNEISEIARHMIKKVLVREGLSRRYSFVNVDQKVIDEIAREGFHPQFGARALKRSVERMLSQPMARKLSETDSSTPIILNIDREEGSVTIQSKTLNLNIESSDRKSNIPLDEPEMLLKTIDERVASVDKALDKISPDGMINTESISSTEFYYFQCRDVTQHIQYESRKLWNSFKSSAKTRQSKAKNYPGREKQKIFYIADPDYQFPLEVILKHGKPMKYLEEHGIQAKVLGEEPGDKLRRILSETAWLEALYSQSPDKEPQDVRLSLYPYSDQQNREMLHYLKDLYLEYFSDFMKFEVELEDSRESDATVIKVSGPGASLLCQREQGVHIFFHEAVNIYPVQVDCYPGATEGKARDLSQEQDSSEKQNHNRIIRFYHSEDYSFDSQSGLLVKGLPGAFTLKTIKMAGFTLDSAGEES